MPPQPITSAGVPIGQTGTISGSGPPPHKNKPGRTRVACSACRANKQKCDAATRHPCRRCELYGLECDLDGTAIKHTVAKKESVAPYVSNATINENLCDIRERLRRIESSLKRHPDATSDESETDATPSILPLTEESSGKVGDLTPVQFITETIDKIAFSAKDDLPDWSAGEHPWPENTSFSVPPIAVARGLVSVEDCVAAFTFFQGRVQPWHSVMGAGPESSAVAVHNRSPFLFHVILLVATYYNTSDAPRNQDVYKGLTTIVNELLVYHIVCPIVQQTNVDFIRALTILLYYKPVQYQGYETWQTNILGSKSELEAGPIAHASKINALSSMFLHSLIYAAAQSIGLHRAPAEFMKTISDAPLGASELPKTTESIVRLRLWYCVCMADIQGTLQAGRKSLNDVSEALRTTRLFADLLHLPTDARLAANTELYGIVRTSSHTENPARARLRELTRIDADFGSWTTYWTPVLRKAQENGDTIAYTSFFFRDFITFTVHAATFSRWTVERKKSLSAEKNGRPSLRSEDWASLQRLVGAAERFLFMLSTESLPDSKARGRGAGVRGVHWSPMGPSGTYGPLHLDPDVADDFKTAHDPVVCVMFVYSMILLFQMAGMGLINSQLEIQRLNYEATMYATTPLSSYSEPMLPSGKLHRILELGADFLERVSPQKHHPCLRQSHLIRMIIRAGLSKNSQYQFNPSGGIIFSHMNGARNSVAEMNPAPAASKDIPALQAAVVPPSALTRDSPSDSDSVGLLNNPGLDNWLFWNGDSNSLLPKNADATGNNLASFNPASLGVNTVPSYLPGQANSTSQDAQPSAWPGGMVIPSQPLESEIASLINVDPYMSMLMSQFSPGSSQSSASAPPTGNATADSAKNSSPGMNMDWNMEEFSGP